MTSRPSTPLTLRDTPSVTSSPELADGALPSDLPDGPMTDLFGRVVAPASPSVVRESLGGGGDSRHLWPALYCLIRECRPPVVFGEQVESAVAHGWLDLVCNDLEQEDYAVGAVSLPAASVGAPHIRQRLWFVANRDGTGLAVGNVTGERRAPEAAPAWREFERVHAARAWPSWSAESGDGVFVDGLPNIVGQVRGFGNAIVPQVAAAFIAAYQEVNQ